MVLPSRGFASGQPPGSWYIWVIVSRIDSGSSSKPTSFPSVSSYTCTWESESHFHFLVFDLPDKPSASAST